MKQKIIVLMLATLIVSCGSFNEGRAELHINKNISTGQELLDLKAALNEGIINQEEFDKRFELLVEKIDYYLENGSEKNIECIKLFYDM